MPALALKTHIKRYLATPLPDPRDQEAPHLPPAATLDFLAKKFGTTVPKVRRALDTLHNEGTPIRIRIPRCGRTLYKLASPSDIIWDTVYRRCVFPPQDAAGQ